MGSARPLGDIALGSVLLGKYRVDEILGEGGMGVVVRARHLVLDEDVAIKILRDDRASDEAGARMIREAQATRRLRTEHVARVTDSGALDNDVPYIVMELLTGRDLGAILDVRGSLPIGEAVDLVLQACEALAEAHSLGIVHRDVKPANLFLSMGDDPPMLKVLDFGISKSVTTDVKLTQTQSMLGTPAYMSPEQMRSASSVDPRADVWSIGAVLYEIVEGALPFQADNFSELVVKVWMDPPRAPAKMPAGLSAIVLRCLAKQPEERYASMGDLGKALLRFAGDPIMAKRLVDRMIRSRARSATPFPPMAATDSPVMVPSDAASAASTSLTEIEPPRRRRWAPVAAVVGVVAIAAVIIAIVAGGDREPEAAVGAHVGSSSNPSNAATDKPADKPIGSVDRPADKPIESLDNQADKSADKPIGTTDKPIGSADKPIGSTDKPIGSTDKPIRSATPSKLHPPHTLIPRPATASTGKTRPTEPAVTVPPNTDAVMTPPTPAAGSAHPCGDDPYSKREGC